MTIAIFLLVLAIWLGVIYIILVVKSISEKVDILFDRMHVRPRWYKGDN